MSPDNLLPMSPVHTLLQCSLRSACMSKSVRFRPRTEDNRRTRHWRKPPDLKMNTLLFSFHEAHRSRRSHKPSHASSRLESSIWLSVLKMRSSCLLAEHYQSADDRRAQTQP